ncbi:MAG: hypothetical protein M0R77_20190 [Gammaproteobacteria bacterium]|nr:hypothetical protein [Gammaproteobacteria bacterium]
MGLLGAGGLPAWTVAAPRASGDTARWLDALCHVDADLLRLGRDYLRKRPEEAKLAYLAQAVCGDTPREDIARLRAQVREKIHQDFSDGRVVRLQGWLLSCTEARLYALVTLVHTGTS